MIIENIRQFKYRGKKYIISENNITNKINCCCMNIHGCIVGTINRKLDQQSKIKCLHRIISQRKLRRC